MNFSLSISTAPALAVNGLVSLSNMPETPVIPAEIIKLDSPPPITDIEMSVVEKHPTIVDKWSEYDDKRLTFIEQQKGLVSLSVIVPPIEEYRKLHEEIWQLYNEIKGLEVAEDRTKGLKTPSVVDRVTSLSSSAINSSSSSSTSQSLAASQESPSSSVRANKHGTITIVEGDDGKVCEAVTRAPDADALYDWNANENCGSIREKKESKAPSEARKATVRFAEEVPSTLSNSDAAQIGISTCNEHIMNEVDLNTYPESARIELRRINEQMKTLKAAFETMFEVAEYCSPADIQGTQNQLNFLVGEKLRYVTSKTNQETKLKVSPKKEETYSDSASKSIITAADINKERMKVVMQAVKQVPELNEDEFMGVAKSKARKYNLQRQFFLQRVKAVVARLKKATAEEIAQVDRHAEILQNYQKRISKINAELLQAASRSIPAALSTSRHSETPVSTSSHSISTSAPYSQFKGKEERKESKISSVDSAKTVKVGTSSEELATKRLRILKALELVSQVLDENQFAEKLAKDGAKEYVKNRKSLIEDAQSAIEYVEVTTSKDIEEIVTRAKKLKRLRNKVFNLEKVLKAFGKVKKINVNNFTGIAHDAAKEYNRQRTSLIGEAEKALNGQKSEIEKIIIRIKQLEKYQGQVFKLRGARLSKDVPSLVQADKEKYLKELNRLQARMTEEMDPSFFKDEHRVRVKNYNAYRLKVIGALEFVRSKVNQLKNDRISLRIKNMELFVRKLEQENRRLYELLVS